MAANPESRLQNDRVTELLRTSASRASEVVGGGPSLVFASVSHADAPVLRSAAGFSSPEQARKAATAIEQATHEAMQTGETHCLPADASLGAGAEASLWIAPLSIDGRTHGALAVGLGQSPDEAVQASLLALVDSLAVRLDHAVISERLEQLEMAVDDRGRQAEEKSDEILKLSEALFAQDIELLRSTEKLGKVEKLKNDFIEKMSRELRTPLNSIIECVISVLAGENENLSAGARDSLRRALDDGTTFLRTLQSILDLWRIKQAELPVQCQEVNFREVVEEAIFSVQDTLGDKPVHIDRRISEPLPKIRTDLAKINQILFLLLDNAAKFTREGTVVIEVSVVEDRLRCSISDSGIGICADDVQYVWDEFYQVDEARSTRYRGAGLGLTLVRELVALLDGEIEIESEVGRGTTVVFEVPVQPLS